mmetsp:Transcript_17960/g.24877  ORF Transcript_17960/g.24877 Transcript_17960/m.24877 type:complete len:417 (-) Transcript_17960:1481-2731(-)
MPFSSAQVNAISIIPCVTGSLSVIGSLSIIYSICSDWKKKISRIYYRLLLPFSIFDVIFSFTVALGSLPAPEGSHNASWAKGNTATCTAQGFVNSIGYAATYYSASLSISFLLSIRFSKTEDWIKRHVEPYLHIIPTVLAIGPAIAGLPLGVFNWAGNKCWIAAHPLGCDYNDELVCTRGVGDNTVLFRWLAQGMWVMLAFVIVALSMIMIVWSVWTLERRMNARYSSTFDLRGSSSSTEGDLAVQQEMQRTRQIAMQALCYIMSFFLTWAWTYIDRTCMYETGDRPFFFLVIGQFFYPLQGFWNALIYHYRLTHATRRSARLRENAALRTRLSLEGITRQGTNSSQSKDHINLTDIVEREFPLTDSSKSDSSSKSSDSGRINPDNNESSDLENQDSSDYMSRSDKFMENLSSSSS